MKRTLFFLTVWAVSGVQAIDFTPVLTVKKLEQYSIPILTFDAGGRRVAYKPPPKWQSIGTPECLTLTPPQLEDASMKLMSLRWSAFESTKYPNEEAEQKWAFRMIPSRATEAELLATNESPFTLGLHGSREWILRFRIEGVLRKMSIARCDISPNERLVLLITSEAKDFDAIRQDGIASLFSWEWL